MSRLGAKFGKKANVCFVFPDKRAWACATQASGCNTGCLAFARTTKVCVCSISRVTSNFSLDRWKSKKISILSPKDKEQAVLLGAFQVHYVAF